MKHIIEGFSVLLILLFNMVIVISVIGVSAKVAAAKEYKAAVVTEIENSNFNTNVIAACIEDADRHGYSLEVDACVFGDDVERQMAQVRLTYDCDIPILGIASKRVARGIAR